MVLLGGGGGGGAAPRPLATGPVPGPPAAAAKLPAAKLPATNGSAKPLPHYAKPDCDPTLRAAMAQT